MIEFEKQVLKELLNELKTLNANLKDSTLELSRIRAVIQRSEIEVGREMERSVNVDVLKKHFPEVYKKVARRG